MLLLGFFVAYLQGQRWKNFVRRLQAEPGIAVTKAEHHWLGASVVEGLRDPLAADGRKIAKEAGVSAAGTRFDWKEYLALDPVSIRRRFGQRFGLPKGPDVIVQENSVMLKSPKI